MINIEDTAAGTSALRYLSFGFALGVLFVKGKWDHKSALQGAKGREDRNFQQVAWKKDDANDRFPMKEMSARILPRYPRCIAATARSVSLFLAGALIHSSLSGSFGVAEARMALLRDLHNSEVLPFLSYQKEKERKRERKSEMGPE